MKKIKGGETKMEKIKIVTLEIDGKVYSSHYVYNDWKVTSNMIAVESLINQIKNDAELNSRYLIFEFHSDKSWFYHYYSEYNVMVEPIRGVTIREIKSFKLEPWYSNHDDRWERTHYIVFANKDDAEFLVHEDGKYIQRTIRYVIKNGEVKQEQISNWDLEFSLTSNSRYRKIDNDLFILELCGRADFYRCEDYDVKRKWLGIKLKQNAEPKYLIWSINDGSYAGICYQIRDIATNRLIFKRDSNRYLFINRYEIQKVKKQECYDAVKKQTFICIGKYIGSDNKHHGKRIYLTLDLSDKLRNYNLQENEFFVARAYEKCLKVIGTCKPLIL